MRIILVHDAPQLSDVRLVAQLSGLGYEVQTACGSDINLPELIQAFRPEAIIIATDSDARDTLEHVAVATQHDPRPIALFCGDTNSGSVRELLRRGVSAYVAEGFSVAKLKPALEIAVARFELDQQWREELAEAKLKLEERKWVERAKGLLMKKMAINEDQAYMHMRQLAMDKNWRLSEVAQRIIAMAAHWG